MQTDELGFLLDYDAWAMERVFATAAALTADEFSAEAGPGHVSPRDTLLHCISGLRTWRQRLAQVPATSAPESEAYPTLDAARALWREDHALFEAHLTQADLDEDFQHSQPDRHLRAERWKFGAHIVLHNMQHRSELAQALTLLGHSPGEIGLTAFLREHPPASTGD